MVSLPLALALLAAGESYTFTCTPLNGGTTTLYRQALGEGPLLAPVALGNLNHQPSSTVRATVARDGRIYASARTSNSRDLSFDYSLFAFTAPKPERLIERIAALTRPIVASDGTVFVERGVAGPQAPDDGAPRLDELRIDAVPPSGPSRLLLSARGFDLFPIALHREELLVYRRLPAGNDIVAIHPRTGALRNLAAGLNGTAQDFTLASRDGALFFTQANRREKRWELVRLSLEGQGALRVVAQGRTPALLPSVFPDGSVGYFVAGRGIVSARASDTVLLPHTTPGFARVLHVSPSETWHDLRRWSDAGATLELVRWPSREALRIRLPPRCQPEAVGFAP